MTDESGKFLGHPTVIKELKLKVAEALKEVTKLKAAIAELENLPVVHGDLRAKNQSLAKAMLHLEKQLEVRRKAANREGVVQMLTQDLNDLQARKSPAPEKGEKPGPKS